MENIDPVRVDPISRIAIYMRTMEKLMQTKAMKSKRGTMSQGSLRLKPREYDTINRMKPPIPHFRPVKKNISRLLLKNLVKVVSMLQKKQDATTRRLPTKFWSKERFWRLFVLKKIAPYSKRAKPAISFS